MITITHQTARRLRTVLRRSVLGISHRGAIPPLILHAEAVHLRAHYRYAYLAIEFDLRGSFQPVLSIAAPLDALADFEGRGSDPVVIKAAAPERTVVRWNDRGIPQAREYPVTPPDRLEDFPAPPETFALTSPGLLDALVEASCTATGNSLRYALDCLQLRGTTHKVVATDGLQLLIQSGFGLPWDGDLLIKGSTIFGDN